MFIVTISLKTDLIPKERADELFAEHSIALENLRLLWARFHDTGEIL